MCAMMPIFRNRFKSCFAISIAGYARFQRAPIVMLARWKRAYPGLPFIMRKRLVGIRHAMRVFLLLYCIATIVGGVKQLTSQPIGHSFFAASARVRDDPANGQSAAALLVNLNRHLISRAAHATRFDFHRWPHVFDRSLENFQRFFAGLFTNLAQRIVKDIFCYRTLTAPHDAVDELSHQRTAVDRVGQNCASLCDSSSRHNLLDFGLRIADLKSEFRNPNSAIYFAPPFGRLAPYFERLFLRSV